MVWAWEVSGFEGLRFEESRGRGVQGFGLKAQGSGFRGFAFFQGLGLGCRSQG